MGSRERRHRLLWGVALLAASWLAPRAAGAAGSFPPGFQDLTVASGLDLPASMAFLPDGRLLIGEKNSGNIRVVKNGALLATPLLSLPAIAPDGTFFDFFSERGLLGMAADPAFETNGFLYVYYTLCKQPQAGQPEGSATACNLAKNRVARFHVTGNLVDAGSEVILLDDIDSDAGNHNAGWLGFNPQDGY